MDQAFAPLTAEWIPVSPRLRSLRRLLLLGAAVPVSVAAGVVLGVLVRPAVGLIAAVAAAALAVWAWRLIGRNWRSWRYAERDDDLLVTHGCMFRRLVVVPYGRLQFVDVTAGPLERRFGIATVQLHTAAETTDASIPGLTAGEAARLRDRLAALGEARSAGL
jgi:membrane protein YdbS with pleckstrin-like domain